MLNITFHDLPWVHSENGGIVFSVTHVSYLFEALGVLLKCPPTLPKIFIADSGSLQLTLGSEQAIVTPSRVKVVVEWSGATLRPDTKSGIAHAIHAFLKAYGFEKNVLIVFEKIHINDAFVEKNGNIVPVPQLPEPFRDFRGFTVR